MFGGGGSGGGAVGGHSFAPSTHSKHLATKSRAAASGFDWLLAAFHTPPHKRFNFLSRATLVCSKSPLSTAVREGARLKASLADEC
jgi:hypothetical protein